MHESFATPEPVRLNVEVWVGRVDLRASDTDETTVDLVPMHNDSAAEELIAAARVEQYGNQIDVLLPKPRTGLFGGRKGSVRATIAVPTHSAVKVAAGSADVEAIGTFGDATIETGSGDVELETIDAGKIKVGSGDVALRTANGRLDLKSGSGDVAIGVLNEAADLTTGSGDVVLDTASGRLKTKTGSGDIVVKSSTGNADVLAGSGDVLLRRLESGELKAKTGSGDISVGVPDGTAAYLDVTTVTGSVSSDLDGAEPPSDGAPTVAITIQSGSGDVVLQRA